MAAKVHTVPTMAATVPDFLMGLLDQELRNLQEKLLRRVAAEYSLNEEEVIAKMLPPKSIQVVSDNIQVIRKAPPKAKLEASQQCQARIWNRGRGGQCTRNIKESNLCTHHAKELQKEGHLRHGWIHEQPSQEIFGSGKRTKALYITSQ